MVKKLAIALVTMGMLGSAFAQSDNFESGTFPNTGTGWSDAWTNNLGQQFLEGGANRIDGAASMGIFGNSFSSRHFTSPLTFTGVTISWSMKSPVDLSANSGSSFGFQILGPGDAVVITFKFQNGFGGLVMNDGATDFEPAGTLTYSAGAVYDFSISFNPGNNNFYSFSATQRGGGMTTGSNFTFSGASANPASANGVRFFANMPSGSGNDAILDNVQVIPEPSTYALLAGPTLLGALMYVRRRRA